MSLNLKPEDAQAQNYVAAIPSQPRSSRMEIDEFLADAAMTNIFLIALQEIQMKPIEAQEKEDWWTFYNLASIHSEPNEMWNGISSGKDNNGIYCTHGSTVFPTWHRAYLLMYEQALMNKMRYVANRHTDAKEKRMYQDAARRFRLPFWDPYLPRNRVAQSNPVSENIWGLPQILAADKVYVRYPGKKDMDPIDNPLYLYKLPPEKLIKEKGRIGINWDRKDLQNMSPKAKLQTIRTPNSKGETNIDDSKDRTSLNLVIRRQAKNASAKIWQMLNPDEVNNTTRSWEVFANHYKTPGNTVRWDSNVSLESWHDDIHVLVGTGDGYAGHMTKVPVAGFDPIFWLHHCNIDRLFALYQALYPEKFVGEKPSAFDGMHLNSPLQPFRKNATEFYNSVDLKDWKKLGYAMPGSQNLDEDGKEIVKQYLRDTYYWASEGSYPPDSLNYPKDLSKVAALHGNTENLDSSPVVHLEALHLIESKTFQRVNRTIPLSADANISNETIDTGFKDETSNKSLYPNGSFSDGTDPNIKQMRTWDAHISVKKYAFNDSFNIHLFIGKVEDSQSARFMTKKNEVGFAGVFASDSDSGCANCDRQREQGMVYTDVVPITPALVNYLKAATEPDSTGTLPAADIRTLRDLEPEHVVPFLKEHLNWRITDTAANLKSEQDTIDSMLEIAVTDRIFDVPTDSNPLGSYREPTVHPEITQGRVGGYNGQ